MFWRLYYRAANLLRPLARFGLRVFSKFTATKRARVLIHRGSSVLLVRDIFSGDTWSLPGGGVNRGERYEDAASREVREEIGVVLPSDKLTFLGESQPGSLDDQAYEAVFFSYEAKGGVELNVNKWEIVEAKWFEVSDLPEQRDSSIDQVIELIDLEG